MWHKGTRRLETERLILRRFEPRDADAMFSNWASDDEVTAYLTWPTHVSVDVSAAVIADWVAAYANDAWYQWAIVPKDGMDEPIGSISVVRMNEAIEAVTVGYCIGRAWWHQGITSEALSAVIAYLFDEVGVNRIEASHDPRNPHSGGVMRKCGMTYEGTLRSSIVSNQGLSDACYHSILRDEWESRVRSCSGGA